VRRQVFDLYREYKDRLGELRGYCEDLLITLQASRVGLLCGYRPQLTAVHHIDSKRFKYRTLCRLFINEGRSEIGLYRMLGRGMPLSCAALARNMFWCFVQVRQRELGVRSALLTFLRYVAMFTCLLPDLTPRELQRLCVAVFHEACMFPTRMLFGWPL